MRPYFLFPGIGDVAAGITPGDVVRTLGPMGYRMMMTYSERRFLADFDRWRHAGPGDRGHLWLEQSVLYIH